MKCITGLAVQLLIAPRALGFVAVSPSAQLAHSRSTTTTTPLNVQQVFEDILEDIDRKKPLVLADAIAEEQQIVAITSENTSSSFVEDWLWKGVVMVLCALWASNFAAGKLIMGEPGVDYLLYAVSRFSVAALSILPFAIRDIKKLDLEFLKDAAICGSWVAFGYLGQLLGLLTTTASKSCVICSLHCVFVAAIAEYMRTKESSNNTSFDTLQLAPAALAVMGVGIVELQGAGGAPAIGDLLSFAQPIGFGMGYLQLEGLMKRRPEAALAVSAIKLLVVALASFAIFEISPALADPTNFALTIPDFGAVLSSPVAMGGILYTALITTSLALWVESIAFRRVPATDASIILTTEPLFAAAFGAISLGETFGMSDYVGASLIIGACVLATLLDKPEEEADTA